MRCRRSSVHKLGHSVQRASARPLGLPLTVLANLDNFIDQEIKSEDLKSVSMFSLL